MNISEREQTETRRIIEVNDVEFYVENLVQPLGWLRTGSIKDSLVDTSTMRRMKEAGLVRYDDGSRMMTSDTGPAKWHDVDGQCRELFEELNEPYCRLRPKVETVGQNKFGMFDENEDPEARRKAEMVKAHLEQRNPDVKFKLDEEELNAIPVTTR